MITVRYFGAAAEAAGADSEERAPAASIAELSEALAEAHPGLGRVLDVCSFMVDERSAAADSPLPEDALVDVLPPFAGG